MGSFSIWHWLIVLLIILPNMVFIACGKKSRLFWLVSSSVVSTSCLPYIAVDFCLCEVASTVPKIRSPLYFQMQENFKGGNNTDES
jgi:hypothetical protein